MSIKKGLLALAATAITAAVLVAPAMANENIHFLHANGDPIAEGEGTTVHFTGPFSWTNPSGGIACSEATALVTFTTHIAHVIRFQGLNCETTGLLPAFGCQMTSPSAPVTTNIASGEEVGSANPIPLTPLSIEEAEFQNFGIDLPMQAGCAFGSRIEMFETPEHILYIHTNTPGEIGATTLTGELETTLGPVEVNGEMTPTPAGPTILVAE